MEAVEEIAKAKGVTVGQVAISWVRRMGMMPIPGTTTVERLVENTTDVPLSEEDLKKIQTILDTLPIQGPRYGGEHEKLLSL